MRVLSLKEIFVLEPGETIPSFKARIKKLFKHVEKPDSKNPGQNWSYQFAIVEQAGDECKVSFKNQAAFGDDWIGATIYVMCNEGDRGLTGIKRDIDDYDKKNLKPMISVTATAKIEEAGGDTAAAPAASAPAQRQAPAETQTRTRQTQSAPAQPAPEPQHNRPATQQTSRQTQQNEPAAQTKQQRKHSNPDEPPLKEQLTNYNNARKFAMRTANAMRINLDAAVWLSEVFKADYKSELPPEGVRAIAITMTIEMAKKIGIGMLPAMSIEDLMKKIEEEKNQPKS